MTTERDNNYLKYRGKCKEFSEALAKEKGYRVVRGWYYDPIWNREEQHWWCVDENGTIHDPTYKQFAAGGFPENYREYDGLVECSNCGKSIEIENEGIAEGRYFFCQSLCYAKFVGVA